MNDLLPPVLTCSGAAAAGPAVAPLLHRSGLIHCRPRRPASPDTEPTPPLSRRDADAPTPPRGALRGHT